MRNLCRRCVAVLLVTLFTSLPAAAAVVVIVHPSNGDSLDAKTVQRIFLGKIKKFPSGQDVVPINQAADTPRRAEFDTNILERSSNQIAAYWSKQVFTGKGTPPKEVADDATAIAEVSSNPNAIAYIDSAAVTADVKAITLN